MGPSEQDRSGDGAMRAAGAAWLLPAVVPVIAVAAIALDETFHRDLDYLEH